MVQQTGPKSWYGSLNGKAAFVRENENGTWLVKVKDPTNRLAGHDGWVLLGSEYGTLDAATTATGVT